LIGNELIAQGRIEQQVLISAGLGETMDIGRDTGVTVVTEGRRHSKVQWKNTYRYSIREHSLSRL